MNEQAIALCSKMIGRPISRLRDMTPIEIEACLNAWAYSVRETRT